jgi:hypothetical protein
MGSPNASIANEEDKVAALHSPEQIAHGPRDLPAGVFVVPAQDRGAFDRRGGPRRVPTC